MPFILAPLLSLLLTAMILRVVEAATSGLEFDDWGSAIGVAVVIWAGSWGLEALLAYVPVPASVWLLAFVKILANLVMLLIASAVLSGMRLRGVVGVLVAAVLLSGVDYVVAIVIATVTNTS
jgi:uncharacterized membrane protein YvlD (DUF360 family)